jgi:hypothetical protein
MGTSRLSWEHTISVCRALINVWRRNPDWRWGRSTRRNRHLGHGNERILYNCRRRTESRAVRLKFEELILADAPIA